MDHTGHSQGSMASQAHVMNISSVHFAPSYFSHSEYSSILLLHVLVMILAWLIVLPLSVMLGIARSRHTLAANLSFISLNAVGILFGAIYNGATPDLYENNAHHQMGWVATWIIVGQSALGVINAIGSKNRMRRLLHAYRPVPDPSEADSYRYSHDSGQGTEPSTPERLTPTHAAFDFPAEWAQRHEQTDVDERNDEKRGRGSRPADRLLSGVVERLTSPRIFRWSSLMYDVVDRLILPLGFALFLSGVVVYGGLFRGGTIFSGMAHFVKGGIFFWVGLLALARCMGSFADLGWAWNVKPMVVSASGRTATVPSMEFVESCLIFLYGATNVFLEHLGTTDGVWSAGDLEHVSIAIMFFGGGVCGMLLESTRIRSLLNESLLDSRAPDASGVPFELQNAPRTYGFSFNPLPAIIILLLGIMMSSHHQSSMVSTMMHAQWGRLFVAGALARGVTYVLTYLSPPTSVLPSRPPSEIVTAFCLISGGLIFMSSNSDVVQRMEVYGLNAMFSFTVTMALTALLMAWTVVVLAFKGWAVRQERRRLAVDGFST